MHIGIAGAGIVGRLCALALAERGHRVALHDRERPRGCSPVAAGLLSPLSGRELPEPTLVRLARASLPHWRRLAAQLPVMNARFEGTLAVAHDLPQLDELERGLRRREVGVELLAGEALRAVEPALAPRHARALLLPHEGWVEPRTVLSALELGFEKLGVQIQHGEIIEVAPHRIVAGTVHRYDLVLDCRGLGARHDRPLLRGVRGELVLVDAPEVDLRLPVRLLHARSPVYVVPRGDGRFVVGATLLESEDEGPISVRSTLELLSAAYALHPGFAEARVIGTAVGLRPALPDNLPLFESRDGLLELNGLYRHGYTIGPALAEAACACVESGRVPAPEVACASW